MGEMVATGSKYSDEIRQEAAIQYAVMGNLSAVGRKLVPQIPKQTLSEWAKTTWWAEIVGQVRTENQDAHITRYHRLTEKALEAAEQGIDNLDRDSLSPADIKALAVTGSVATDKARLLQGLSTTNNQSSNDSIQSLVQQFQAISIEHGAHLERQRQLDASVIATQEQSESEPSTD